MIPAEQTDSSYQPALQWRDSAWRYALAFAVAVYWFFPIISPRNWAIADLVIGIASFWLVRYRRRWPTSIALLLNAATALSYGAVGPAMLSTVSMSTRRRWREIVPVAVVMLAASIAGGFRPVTGDSGDYSLAAIDYAYIGMSMMATIGMPIGWGLYIGSRRKLEHTLHQRAERLEQDQELRAQHARDAERAQIAREMHDVLAHRISQVSMQAGAIAYRTDLDADALRRAAADLQASANAALVDLRGVLGVLRDPESGATLDVPQPRFSDIDTLLDHARSSGLRVDSHVDVDSEVDDTIGRTLYRVTQECLTNVRKHAPNATVTIRISGSPTTGIDFVSSNPLPIGRPSQAVPTSGYGLVGLAERAALVGGTLTATESHGEFSVACHLPWDPETETSRTDDVRPAHK